MRSIISIAAGFVLGAVFVVIIVLVSVSLDSHKETVKMFDTGGEYVKENAFRVTEVHDSGNAEADAGIMEGDYFRDSDYDVILLGKEGKYFYDDMMVIVPSGKAARHVGIYRYSSNGVAVDTYPIIDVWGE